MPYFSALYNVQQSVTDYAEHLFQHDMLQRTVKVGCVRVVGKRVKHGTVHNFRDMAVTLPLSSTSYKRTIMTGNMFYSTDYSSSQRRKNRPVCLTDGFYAELLRIFVYPSDAVLKCVLLLLEYDSVRDFFCPAPISVLRFETNKSMSSSCVGV